MAFFYWRSSLLLIPLLLYYQPVPLATAPATHSQPLQVTNQTVQVQVGQLGQMRGMIVNVTNDPMTGGDGLPTGKKVATFLGVRYAEPQIRFERPSPKQPWQGVVDASQPTLLGCVPYFPAIPNWKDVFAEDCLFVDIYTPSTCVLNSQNPKSCPQLPVLVFIHGGGYEAFSTVIYPKQDMVNKYASRDIIMVMVEFRLGPFGFASNGQPGMLGNDGLWDQAMALKWISSNIASFGGDPNRITLIGFSAGSASIDALSASTHTRDLFQQAFHISGSIVSGWALQCNRIVNATLGMAQALGCGQFSGNSPALKQCMRQASTEQIWNASIGTSGLMLDNVNGLIWTPRIDGDFFTKDPVQLLAEAPRKNVVIGNQEMETLVWLYTNGDAPVLAFHIDPPQYFTFNETDLQDFVTKWIAKPQWYGPTKALALRDQLINFYKTNPIQRWKAEVVNQWPTHALDMFDMIWMNHNMIWETRFKSMLGWNVYSYLNTFWPKSYTNATLPTFGAQHSLEQGYWFGLWLYPLTDPFPPTNFTQAEIGHQSTYLAIIENFVKNGNPSIPGTSWPQVQPKGPLDFVQIDDRAIVQKGFHEASYEFFNRLIRDFPEWNIIRGDSVCPVLPPAQTTPSPVPPLPPNFGSQFQSQQQSQSQNGQQGGSQFQQQTQIQNQNGQGNGQFQDQSQFRNQNGRQGHMQMQGQVQGQQRLPSFRGDQQQQNHLEQQHNYKYQ